MSEPPTRKLGRYEIRKELGKGAMGAVYLARDTLLERDVALKVMASATTSDPDLKQRFEREAKAVARLQHSNIVTVYDLGYDEAGSPFIAMEFLQGRDLEQIIQKDPPPLPQKLDIIVKVCRGLAHAHGHGIIHRDVKPANIFVTTGGETKIMDFGVARLAQSSQTRTGMILGTADYMAPEQISGQRVDARADIFSLGVVLYRLLTQKKPFAGESMQAVFYKILNVDPPALALPGSQALPELQGIVGRALAKDPAARFQTADEMAGAIEGFLRRHPEALSKGGAFALAAAPGAGLGPESAEATPARKTTLPPESVPLGAAAGAGPVGAPSGPGESTAAPGTAALKPPQPTARPRAGVPSVPSHRSPWLAVLALALAAAGGAYLYWDWGQPERQPLSSAPPHPENLETQAGQSQPQQAEPQPVQAEPAQTQPAQTHEVQPVVPPSPTTARAKASPETLSPPAPSDAQKAQLLVGEAGMALAEGDLDRARALLEQGLRLDPSNPRWRRLRQQLRRRGELARIQRMRAERLSAYLRQAVKHIEAQNYGRAIEAYERALRDDPNNAAAIAGKANALTLKQQLELAQRQQQQRPAVALTRRFIRGTTRYIPPPVEGAGKDEGPEGFQRRGRVEAKRATQAPKFPAEILIELRPGSVRAGDPFKLLIRMNNKGNGPVHVKFLELVWSFGGKKIGQGQQIPVRVQRVNARASVVLHEVDGIWTEEQSAGSLTATVTLLGNGKLANTLRW